MTGKAEKSAKLARQQEEGAQARMIVEAPIFARVLTAMVAGNIDNWRSHDPADAHAMQRFHALDGFLREFRETFEAISVKGEDARKEMARLAKDNREV